MSVVVEVDSNTHDLVLRAGCDLAELRVDIRRQRQEAGRRPGPSVLIWLSNTPHGRVSRASKRIFFIPFMLVIWLAAPVERCHGIVVGRL